MTAQLRRVLLRPPGGSDGWERCGWRGEPDPVAIAHEHESLCATLERAGAEVVLAEPTEGNPDAIYVFDPVLVADGGAILLNPGKECRRGEPASLAPDLERAGVPVAGSLNGDAHAEGGDLIRLDEEEGLFPSVVHLPVVQLPVINLQLLYLCIEVGYFGSEFLRCFI